MKLQKSIVALFALFVFAVSANAQFGDLIEKAAKKVDKTTRKVGGTTNVSTNGGGQNSEQTGDDVSWESALKNTSFKSSINNSNLKSASLSKGREKFASFFLEIYLLKERRQ